MLVLLVLVLLVLVLAAAFELTMRMLRSMSLGSSPTIALADGAAPSPLSNVSCVWAVTEGWGILGFRLSFTSTTGADLKRCSGSEGNLPFKSGGGRCFGELGALADFAPALFLLVCASFDLFGLSCDGDEADFTGESGRDMDFGGGEEV